MTDSLPIALERSLAAGTARPITTLETHISWLFFDDRRVFKVKKPVKLPFLDYSTLERRKHFCDEEVRLGRRLGGDIYRGVVPIVRDANGSIRLGRSGGEEVIDYAVEMVRLPASSLLDHLLAEGNVDNSLIERVLSRLARFETEAARSEEISRHGKPEELASLVRGNLAEAAQIAPASVLSSSRTSFLRRYLDRFLLENHDHFEARVAEGRIREGHGDLHAGNLCDLGDRIVAYDCIEFDPKLRCLDPAAEIAFLAMDIEMRGFPAFAGWLVKRAEKAFDDSGLARLVPFYVVHYAIVRAKVALLRGVGSNHLAEARRYFDLATARAIPPMLFLTCGLPACGKSTFSAALARAIHATVLHSDVVRKELHGMTPAERDRQGDRAGIYSPEASDQLYSELLLRASERLRSGHFVIVDASFATRDRRAPFLEFASASGIPIACAHVRTPESVVRERLERRSRDPLEPSDADLDVYLAAKERFEEPMSDGEFSAGRVFVVDSTRPEDDVIHDALESLAYG